MRGARPLLAVDDDTEVLTALTEGLRPHEFDVSPAHTGREALAVLSAWQPAVVVLDLCLPDIGGVEVTRRLRTYSDVPVLLFSGAADESSRIAGLRVGADAFVAKPCSLAELAARIAAVLRRGARTPARSCGVLTLDDVEIDIAGRSLVVAGRPTSLTATEWRLLEVLAAQPGYPLSYTDVIHAVWSVHHGDESRPALRAHLRSLRRKLGDDPRAPRFVRTERHFGVRWIAPLHG